MSAILQKGQHRARAENKWAGASCYGVAIENRNEERLNSITYSGFYPKKLKVTIEEDLKDFKPDLSSTNLGFRRSC